MACVSVPLMTTMAEGAGIGALGGGAMGAMTGGNPLKDALMGGVMGGLTGGIGSSLGVLGGSAADSAVSDASAIGDNATVDDFGQAIAPVADNSTSSGIGSYLASKNPLSLALAGTTGLGAISSLLPKKQVNIGQNAANVMATNPSFSNPNLPSGTMQNTATPYAGNWNTYGFTPQPVMYNAQPTQQSQFAKTGGMIKGYAMGGPVSVGARTMPMSNVSTPISAMPVGGGGISNPITSMPIGGGLPRGPVNNPIMSMPVSSAPKPPVGSMPIHHLAGGGMPLNAPMQMPQALQQPPLSAPILPQQNAPQMPPQGMQQPGMPPQKPVNPLALAAAHKVGVVIGKHLRSKGMTPDGQVHGAGGGHDDAVPARLSQDEYVMPADIPSALGDGSSNEGAKRLDAMVANVRAHKTSNGSKFPPKAKNPLSYLPKKGKV